MWSWPEMSYLTLLEAKAAKKAFCWVGLESLPLPKAPLAPARTRMTTSKNRCPPGLGREGNG